MPNAFPWVAISSLISDSSLCFLRFPCLRPRVAAITKSTRSAYCRHCEINANVTVPDPSAQTRWLDGWSTRRSTHPSIPIPSHPNPFAQSYAVRHTAAAPGHALQNAGTAPRKRGPWKMTARVGFSLYPPFQNSKQNNLNPRMQRQLSLHQQAARRLQLSGRLGWISSQLT